MSADGNSNAGGTNGDLFDFGDVVEHRMNTNVFGVIIGFAGSLVGLRVSPSLAVLWFHEWELRPMEDDGEPVEGAVVDAAADNVIDFTRARDLRTAKTKGVA